MHPTSLVSLAEFHWSNKTQLGLFELQLQIDVVTVVLASQILVSDSSQGNQSLLVGSRSSHQAPGGD